MGTINANFSWSEFERTSPENERRLERMNVRNVIDTSAKRDAVLALVRTLLQPLRNAWGGMLIPLGILFAFHYFGRLFSHKSWSANRIRR